MTARPLDAGDFGTWLVGIQQALDGDGGSDVPCDGCTACCRSSQFIPIEPDETETRSHIPPELLFPAPRRPEGHALLGYDEHGRCPMLVDDACSIYEHRPRACRRYDCRVLAATGLGLAEDADQPLVAERARRWRFAYATPGDRDRDESLRAAASYLDDHAGDLPEGAVPAHAAPRAALAIGIHDLFLGREPDAAAVGVAVELRARPRAAGSVRRPGP
jgi:uncharacterized protein